ncbi:MAG: UDP-N-acetylmuramoylalanine--D-glutamate ligase [Parcubacteria group bacterium]|nr:UDP-N-acetylmuramoylalanine--D-glutamate ligase [Parcubacteria group bacterium]
MNKWKDFLSGKKVTLMGLGLLGRGSGDAAFLATYVKELTITDLKSESQLKESKAKLKKFKHIRYTLGRHDLADFENRDFIIKGAGVPLDSLFIHHARNCKIPVYMSTALFAKYTEAVVIGVTGTRGKTTVSYMLYHILKEAYKGKNKKVYLGGNVQGVSTLPMLEKVKRGDIMVLELDSWQLQGFGDLKISPSVAVFTTFMPDHLNYYKNDLKAYFKDKGNIFLNQKKGDIFIAGAQLKDQKLSFPFRTMFASAEDLPKDIKLGIAGEHNRYNAGLAVKTAREFGIPLKTIKKALASFKGVPGRLEKRGVKKGIIVYNDTTATTPHALIAALSAFEGKKNIVLIMGGADKNIELEGLKDPLAMYAKSIILLDGTGTQRLLSEKVLPENTPHSIHKNLKSAVKQAFKEAKKGDIVLLSPGFASFGMFINEYDRGDQFNDLIKKIK